MSAHTFRQREALARLASRTVRPAAPWWLWAVLIAGVAVVWGAAAMEVLP